MAIHWDLYRLEETGVLKTFRGDPSVYLQCCYLFHVMITTENDFVVLSYRGGEILKMTQKDPLRG